METLINLLPLIGGGIFGAVVKLMASNAQNKKEEHQMLMATLTKRQDAIDKVNELASKSKGFSFARRTIAFTITSIIFIVAIFPLFFDTFPINVSQTITTGGEYLFGLIDTRETSETWVQLKGAVIVKEVGLSFQAIVGAYFGASIAGSK